MALKPTIHKFRIQLSDLDRERFEEINLTVARHPSETAERMMARVLAYCLNVDEGLALCKGLSDAEEPDLWRRSLDERIECWIDVGEPVPERLKKATNVAEAVRVYSFNSKSGVWWRQNGAAIEALGVQAFQFDWDGISELAALLQRGMEFPLTVSGDTLYLSLAGADVSVQCQRLSAAG